MLTIDRGKGVKSLRHSNQPIYSDSLVNHQSNVDTYCWSTDHLYHCSSPNCVNKVHNKLSNKSVSFHEVAYCLMMQPLAIAATTATSFCSLMHVVGTASVVSKSFHGGDPGGRNRGAVWKWRGHSLRM